MEIPEEPETEPTEPAEIPEEPETEPAEPVITYPAQTLVVDLNGIRITAEAAEGAFPEGTRMEVREVVTDELPEMVSDAIPEFFQQLQALDISFYTEADELIQPLAKVRITIQLPKTSESEESLLIRMDQDGNASLVEQEDPEAGSMILFEVGPDTAAEAPEGETEAPEATPAD